MTGRPHQPSAPPRRLILLGSTGSIGTQTLEVVRRHPDRFEVVALAAGSNADLLSEQADEFGVTHTALASGNPNACAQLVDEVEADVLVGAVVGSAGLPATLRAIERGMTIALANKETLVAAGELVVPLAEKHRVDLVPIDSEHSAIFQCVQGHANGTVKKIVLTASGGPFRTWPADEIRNATVEQALNHPTWNMGRKITIDSASMMNKALEIVEAHWLFGLGSDQIDVIIHPQSIAHSFVEFADHSILAQLGTPDMRTPIQYALTWPDRAAGTGEPLDWSTLSQLDFEPPDPDRFPAIRLARRVIDAGGTAGAVFNAANEVAVDRFLEGNLLFGRIVELVEAALDACEPRPIASLDDVLDADRTAREFVAKHL